MRLTLNEQPVDVSYHFRDQLEVMLSSEGPIEVDLSDLQDVPPGLMRRLICGLHQRGNTQFRRGDGSRLVDPLQSVDETSNASEAITQILTLGVVYHPVGEREQAIRDCLRRVGVRAPRNLAARCATEQCAIDAIDQTPVSLATHLGAEAPVGDHVIPPGWVYDGTFTRRLEGWLRPMSPDSLEGLPYIRSVYVNADTHTQMVELAWLHRGRTIVEIVARAACLTEKFVEHLINHGLPLAQPTASLFVEYCRAYFAANIVVEVQVVERFGWHGTGPSAAFVYGRDVLGNRSQGLRLNDADPAVAELADGLASGGEQPEAYALLRELATFPIAAFVAAGALSSLLLAKLGVPGFVIDIHGETSTGKTTLLTLVASLFGSPASLLQAWNVTTVFSERAAGIRRHLPLFLDDSRQADPGNLSSIVYELCNGRGKGRGNKTGIDVSATWQLAVISTGEQSLPSFGEKGGIRARVIGIDRPLFEPRGPAMKARLENLIARAERHHGHVARQFVAAILATDAGALQARLDELNREYTAQLAAAGTLGMRQARYIAVIRLAGEIAARNFNIPALNDPVSAVLSDLLAQGHEADQPREALLALHTYVHQYLDCFPVYPVPGEAKRTPRGYWMSDGSLAVYPPDFEAVMEEIRFPPKEILSAWKLRQWLRCENDRFRCKVRINGHWQRMIVIVPSAFTAVRADEPAVDERGPSGA